MATAFKINEWIQLEVGNCLKIQKHIFNTFIDMFIDRLNKNGIGLARRPIVRFRVIDGIDAIAKVDHVLRGGMFPFTGFILIFDTQLRSQIWLKLKEHFRRRVTIFSISPNQIDSSLPGRGSNHKLDELVTQFGAILGKVEKVQGCSQSRNVNEEKTMHPMGFDRIRQICADLDSRALLIGSSALLRQLQGDSFFRRLDEPWSQVQKHAQLLQATVAVVLSTQADLLRLTNEFLTKVIDSKLISFTVHYQIMVLMTNVSRRDSFIRDDGSKLVQNHLLLLNLAIERLPTKAGQPDMIGFIQNTIYTLGDEELKTGWWSDILQQLLDRLIAAYQGMLAKKKLSVLDDLDRSKKQRPPEGPPPENFRSLTITPIKEDVLATNNPYLRPALTKGKYIDDEHYLDVQFRLLREDFIRPLRDGIKQYHEGGQQRRRGLFVYADVHIGFAKLHKFSGEMIYTTKFQTARHLRWHKRLIHGSMVCLSSDDFIEHFLFAIIFDRNVDQLAKGLVGLLIDGFVNHDCTYRMVESSAYFEAYQHVLQGLQAIPPDEPVPFSRYLVAAETNVELPQFFRNYQSIDMKTIVKMKNSAISFSMPVHRMANQLTAKDCNLDESQWRALQLAMKSELVVIQGPPGTGKTFIGHQLARLLIDNRSIWNNDRKHPMLVVCYTNHALDQFLEGIAEFVDSAGPMIRVGGRCKNENLEKYLMRNICRNHSNFENRDLCSLYYSTKSKQKMQINELSCIAELLTSLDSKIISFNTLHQRIAIQHEQQFSTNDMRHPSEVFVDWLTLFDNVVVDSILPQPLKHPMNAEIVRELMYDGIPEVMAKNATFMSQGLSTFDAFNILLWNVNNPDFCHPLPETANWPLIEAVDRLRNMGFHDKPAIEALVSENHEFVRAANRLRRYFFNPMQHDEPPREEVVEVKQNINDQEDILDLYDQDDEQTLLHDIDEDFDGGVELIDSKKFVSKMFEVEQEAEQFCSNDNRWLDANEQKNRSKRVSEFKKRILSVQKMSADKVNAVVNIWTLSLPQRWKLYQFWVDTIRTSYRQKLHTAELVYGEITKRLREVRGMSDTVLFQSALVLGMTTTGAAKHQTSLRTIQPRVVIMEEAAEVLEAHLVSSLTTGCRHAILIGDHKQLRPNPAVYELAKNYGLDVSLFERLINNNFPYATLVKQHRMRPEIARPLMPLFYEDLQDDQSVYEYPHVRGVIGDLLFLTHSVPEKNDQDARSHSNQYEAEFAVRLARYFLQQDYQPCQVTILVAYLEQMMVTRKLAMTLLGQDHRMRIEVVDNYQGEESDIIILSLVRSNNPEGKIGFLSVHNRVCVALSRAKHGLYCIGNLNFLAEHSPLWTQLRQSLEEVNAVRNDLPIKCYNHQTEQSIGNFKEFDEKSPEGGCQEPCNGRLDCGHMCSMPCHASDPEHAKVICTKPCTRSCPNDHQCSKRCDQDCGNCMKKIEKQLPCGHMKRDFCYIDPEEMQCVVSCPNELACGHLCVKRCSQPCTTNCRILVDRTLPICEHTVQLHCSMNPASTQCTTQVTKTWSKCGHSVKTICSVDIRTQPCPQECGKSLPGCEHVCKGTCGQCRQGRLHVACTEKCTRILICGHECRSKCNKSCPPCERPCETECIHSRCGRVDNQGNAKKLRNKQRKNKGRLCGDPCPFCTEECPNQCEHRQCGMYCFQPCTIGPCDQPCLKALPCGPQEGNNIHRCIGLCGEECPNVCSKCNPEEYAGVREIFFGREDEEDALFVQLKDCGHIFEMTGLDEWVRQKTTPIGDTDIPNGSKKIEIVTIDCPRCKAMIRRSTRYTAFLTQRALDIEKVKLAIRGNDDSGKTVEISDLDMQRMRLVERSNVFVDALKNGILNTVGGIEIRKFVDQLQAVLKKPDAKSLTMQRIALWKNVFRVLAKMTELYSTHILKVRMTMTNSINVKLLQKFAVEHLDQSPKKYLMNEWVSLLDCLTSRHDSASTVMMNQFASEMQRFSLLAQLISWIDGMCQRSRDITDDSCRLLVDIMATLDGDKDIDGLLEARVMTDLSRLLEMHSLGGLGVSENERVDIVTAVGTDVTTWIKCSNGHYYGIGNCGQAMEESVCPECKEKIGGTRHRLVPTSSETNEVNPR